MKKLSLTEIGGMLAAAGASTFFGLSYLFTKTVVDNTSTLTLLSWRFFFGSLAMTLLALVGLIHIDFWSKSPWPLLKMSLCMPGLYFLLETYGIQCTSASESGTIMSCIPVFTVIASALFLHRKPRAMQIAGVLISTLGILILVLIKGVTPSFSLLGYLLLFCAVATDVAYIILTEQLTGYTAVEKTYFMCLTGTVLFSVLALVENMLHGTITLWLTLPFTHLDFLGSAVYLGLGCTTIAFLLMNRAVTLIGPTRMAAFSGITTVVSVLSGVLFLHDGFSLLQGLATVLVLGGVYCVNIFAPPVPETKISSTKESKNP